MDIILASASPRRRDLLERAGVKFRVLQSDVDEALDDELLADPHQAAQELAQRKAGAVVQQILAAKPEGVQVVVIGADTIVFFQNKILGKPKNEEDAFRMLKAMSGKIHTVFTGVTIIDTESDLAHTFYEETKVEFYDVTDDEIRNYISTGDPLDKAGSYGVQGRGCFLVKRIEGDYFTVVGLPIAHLIQILKKYSKL